MHSYSAVSRTCFTVSVSCHAPPPQVISTSILILATTLISVLRPSVEAGAQDVLAAGLVELVEMPLPLRSLLQLERVQLAAQSRKEIARVGRNPLRPQYPVVILAGGVEVAQHARQLVAVHVRLQREPAETPVADHSPELVAQLRRHVLAFEVALGHHVRSERHHGRGLLLLHLRGLLERALLVGHLSGAASSGVMIRQPVTAGRRVLSRERP